MTFLPTDRLGHIRRENVYCICCRLRDTRNGSNVTRVRNQIGAGLFLASQGRWEIVFKLDWTAMSVHKVTQFEL